MAAFHTSAPRAEPGSRFGSPGEILDLAIENFTEIEPLLEHDADRRAAADLRRWTEREHAARATLFSERQRSGFVRECHGDLHLGNIALVDGLVTIFDCIEFNEDMRWSDVMADVAFLVMDLRDRGRPDLASRFLSGYLERTGDYDGVQILRFYVVYRAMVRAKVACMRASQIDEPPPGPPRSRNTGSTCPSPRAAPSQMPPASSSRAGCQDRARPHGRQPLVESRRRHPHPDGRRAQTHPRADADWLGLNPR